MSKKETQHVIVLIILLIGDLLALLSFVITGGIHHNRDMTIRYIFDTAYPFVISWVVVGYFVGAFSVNVLHKRSSMVWRTLMSWFIASIVGIAIYSWARGVLVNMDFILVTFAMTLLLIGGWRIIFTLVYKKVGATRE